MSMRRLLLLASMSVLACGTEEPAPDQPTWADDVLPILRANCFSCHGPTANYKKYQNKRWDVYERGDPNATPPTTYVRLGFGNVTEDIPDNKGMLIATVTEFGAKDNALLFSAYIENTDEKIRMPPPPATRLSPQAIQTIKNWVSKDNPNALALGTHHPNHKAAITWLDKRARLVAVTDEDGDTVVGKLDCGGTPVSFDHAGSFTIAADATLPCTGTLYDGFAETAVNLK
jgi:hypothetical protein